MLDLQKKKVLGSICCPHPTPKEMRGEEEKAFQRIRNYLSKTKTKNAPTPEWGCSSVVDCFPTMCEA
jgi:hypothetical protein